MRLLTRATRKNTMTGMCIWGYWGMIAAPQAVGQLFRGNRSSMLVWGSRTLCPGWAHIRVVGCDRCSVVGVEGTRPGSALQVRGQGW